jgi:DegV family protein with EDD domain
MEKIGFIVDSTCYLPQKFLKDNKIQVVSLNVIDGDETLKELEIDNDFVFKRQDEKARLTTSQPSPSEFVTAYEESFKAGNTKVLVLTIGQGLSGTYQSAILAKNMMKNPDDVYVFDSNNAAYGNELLAMEIVSMIKAGKSFEAIIKRMDGLFDKTYLMFTVENLFSLQKGGRLSKTQAMIGTVLKVKPVIKIVEGKLKLYHKERTHKKLHQFFIDEIKNDPNFGEKKKLHIRLIQRDSLENLTAVEALVKENFKNVALTVQDYLGPVFSIHVGPKGFGLCWFFE